MKTTCPTSDINKTISYKVKAGCCKAKVKPCVHTACSSLVYLLTYLVKGKHKSELYTQQNRTHTLTDSQ